MNSELAQSQQQIRACPAAKADPIPLDVAGVGGANTGSADPIMGGLLSEVAELRSPLAP